MVLGVWGNSHVVSVYKFLYRQSRMSRISSEEKNICRLPFLRMFFPCLPLDAAKHWWTFVESRFVNSILASYLFIFGILQVQILACESTYPDGNFYHFSHSLQVYSRVAPQKRPWLPSTISFLIHFSLSSYYLLLYSLCYWKHL